MYSRLLAVLFALLTPLGAGEEAGAPLEQQLVAVESADLSGRASPARGVGWDPGVPPVERHVPGGSAPAPAGLAGPARSPEAEGPVRRPDGRESGTFALTHLARCGHRSAHLDLPPPSRRWS